MTTHPKTVASFRDRAEQYLREDCEGPPLLNNTQIANLLGPVSGRTVLCVGAGGGAECRELLKRGAIVSAVEPSPSLRKIASESCPGVVFKGALVESLPYADSEFDIVYCAHVLHYLRDWTASLSEIWRVLRDEGRVLITVHHPLDYGLAKRDGARFLGYDSDGSEVGEYLTLREECATWYDSFEVVYYPRSVSEMIRNFLEQGFRLRGCLELGATEGSRLPILAAFSLEK
jgi:SAM-dependent methyltransferase